MSDQEEIIRYHTQNLLSILCICSPAVWIILWGLRTPYPIVVYCIVANIALLATLALAIRRPEYPRLIAKLLN